jgi:hypothetical protein
MRRPKKQKLSKKIQKLIKNIRGKVFDDFYSLLLLAVIIIFFAASYYLLIWLRTQDELILTMQSGTINTLETKQDNLIKFYGPDGFAFEYPKWSEIKAKDLPKDSFPPNVKLLLMETNNESMQLMAIETTADAKKDLKTIIADDIKEESTKVSNLQIFKQDVGDTVANMELTYAVDGFIVHMLSKDFLVKNKTENKVYSLAVQIVDSEFNQNRDLAQKIIDSAQIIALPIK